MSFFRALVICCTCISLAFADSTGNSASSLRKRSPTIAVLPFQNTTPSATEAGFGPSLASMLSTHLRTQTNFVVVERNQIGKVLDEQSLAVGGITKDGQEQLRKLKSVEVLLTGSVAKFEGAIQLDARLISVETGNVIVAEYVEIPNDRDLRAGMSNLARSIEDKYLRQWMGDVTVNVAPVEGEVYLDGNFVGKARSELPLKIPRLLEGEYKMRVIAGGYRDHEETVVIQPKSERRLQVMLRPLPGSVMVKSNPAGATVLLDGEEVGVTPLSLPEIERGGHLMAITMNGYQPWGDTVYVRPGQVSEVQAEMDVIPGILTLVSKPAGAKVFLDGNFLGKTPLHRMDRVVPGNYVVRLELPSYEVLERKVTVKPGEATELTETLNPERGTLTLITAHQGVRVTGKRDGKVLFTDTLPSYQRPLEVGEVELTFELPHYKTETHKVSIVANTDRKANVSLDKMPGTLTFPKDDSRCWQTRVDGQDRGLSCSIGELQLSEGLHQIELRHFHEQQNLSAQIVADQNHDLKVPQPNPGHSRWAVPLGSAVLMTLLAQFF